MYTVSKKHASLGSRHTLAGPQRQLQKMSTHFKSFSFCQQASLHIEVSVILLISASYSRLIFLGEESRCPGFTGAIKGDGCLETRGTFS